ncbi:ornithine cyclodeaminase family protein [Leisingera sp. M658]|uniref:ornithine cyclodeaminase family protein n=1 Tax=Leisingera sp. M658 TaxID=2867015 RepID=UPI0021A263F3|nr:ornithine cyclodeaminase family protein [Leisingera sp. M658]UWQ76367.1 ornithine cyclodeaminase family protein [Leisingera sp. M658]
MARIEIEYLGQPEVDRVALSNDDILDAVEQTLVAAGRNKTVIEPRMHLTPDPAFNGHFNVLRGYVAPLDYAGVKIVGDYVDNYKQGLPSELALLNLFCPRTGAPRAVIDAAGITDMRTGALTALGAKWLGPKTPKILGHVGARGTSYWNVRLLDHLFDFEEIRIHSRRPESREAFAERLRQDLGKDVTVTTSWQSCLEGADILVEATRLNTPAPMFNRAWVKPGAFVVPYGTMSTLPLDFIEGFDKLVMDDLGQMRAGHLGALRPHIDAGLVSEETFYAEIGEIAAGLKPGREADSETILFWHRGMSTSDIALGAKILERARELGIVQNLLYRDA